MASGSSDPPGGEDRRQIPKDMQGLLRVCAGMTDPSNPSETVSFNSMSQERREFLEKALDDMSVNPVQRLSECVRVLTVQEETEGSIGQKIQALEELTEWCEQIDLAIDLHKIGGFPIFPVVLKHPEAEIRWLGCELIATMVQNNPYSQNAAVQENLVPEILHLLDTDPNPTVKTKSMYAVSCLIRDCEAAQKIFIENDGFSVLMRAMQTDIEKLKIKAAFLLSSVCKDQPKYKDILCDIGMIDQLIGNLCEEHTAYHEHIMSALLTIVENHARSVTECCRPELNFLAVLNQRKQELEGKDEFREELEYAGELLKFLTENNDSTTESQEAVR